MKRSVPPKEEPVQKAPVTPEKTEKPEKEKAPAEKEKAEIPAPEIEKIPKPNIDLHIVGKIDLDTIGKETKAVEKEEHKEKPEVPQSKSREKDCQGT